MSYPSASECPPQPLWNSGSPMMSYQGAGGYPPQPIYNPGAPVMSYPPQPIYNPGSQMMSYPPQPIYNPPVPLTKGIQGGMFPGKMIFISGNVKPSANRFTFNIQDGMHDGCDKALHVDVRINVEGWNNAIIRNAFSKGSWGPEEINQPYFPFSKGKDFEILILVETECFKVAVDNQHFIEFKHRLGPLGRFNVVNISGDITLQQVRFQ